jgi:hypothetical protein
MVVTVAGRECARRVSWVKMEERMEKSTLCRQVRSSYFADWGKLTIGCVPKRHGKARPLTGVAGPGILGAAWL